MLSITFKRADSSLFMKDTIYIIHDHSQHRWYHRTTRSLLVTSPFNNLISHHLLLWCRNYCHSCLSYCAHLLCTTHSERA